MKMFRPAHVVTRVKTQHMHCFPQAQRTNDSEPYDYFLIATDRENSVRQITKRIRYPELHTYRIHHNILEAIIKAIRNSMTRSIKYL